MTNMLWCDPGTQVLILHSDHPFKRYPYWSAVARAAGARVRYLPGPRAHAVEGLFAAHDDFSIAPASLQQMLEGTGTAADPGAADANGRMVTA
jgi:hypothetical protein